MRTEIPFSKLPSPNALLDAYLNSYDSVASWFHYNPHDPGAVGQRIAALEDDPLLKLRAAERGPYVAALVTQQQRWDCGSEALANAQALGRERTYAVLTGQQAGLFGGPLYTLLKALTVVKLARRLKQQHPDADFVPLFWIASGDSDFEEVRHCYLPCERGDVRDLALHPEADEDQHKLIGVRDVSDDLQSALEALESCLPSGEYRDEVYGALKHAYRDGNLVDGFARWLATLCKGTGLVIMDFQDPVLKGAGKLLFRRELADSAKAEATLLARNEEISAAGFPLQVEHTAGDTSLFFCGPDGVRDKIARDGDGFVLRHSGRRMQRDELLTIASLTPEWIVPGVLNLPVCQNVVFPVAAWVGGGAEIAYRAQVTSLFDFHHQQMAPAYMRASATLLHGKDAALLDDLGWGVEELFAPRQELEGKAVREDVPQELEQALEQYRAALAGADADVVKHAVEIDPNLGKTFETLRGNLARHADKVEKKITSALKSQRQQLIKRVDKVHGQVYPHHAPQERVLSVLGFLPRYGFRLVERLLDEINVPGWQHQVIKLD